MTCGAQPRFEERSSIDFEIISAGHLPHDENPEAVNKARHCCGITVAHAAGNEVSIRGCGGWSLPKYYKISQIGGD